ncbi:helix-turn-helix domain-containing protein [Marinoscillum furvescens]|uniref:Helix-turn-helix protein n=1 Tax=Marinoscillum furvescens DSM 4134 TaxID=1122208 RepID=A0A3D9L8Z3_MARFU|nr:helix-turn-helix transcriptional regulator [Marinoscillum furvescens]REE01746.1 helix-turn-helix protein [Marinoscillum furvescens DSM 4134]
MMNQPQLGQRLAAIRKEKNWTQEELVAQSNVSVRTIQRIEAGEVTPRFATVKILLAALEYDLDDWNRLSLQADEPKPNFIQKMTLSKTSLTQQQESLNTSWIAGIVYLIMLMLEIGADALILSDGIESSMIPFYATLKLLVAISFFLFMRGFVGVGSLFENHQIRIAAYVYAFVIAAISFSDVVLAIYYPDHVELNSISMMVMIILIGAAEVVFGVSLMKLQDSLGQSAKVAGILEIITGICFMTVVFVFVGMVTMFPAMILEILVLYKAYDFIMRQKTNPAA